MTHGPSIEIVTVYNASQTTGARARLHLLGIASLIVGAVWLWSVHARVYPWVKQKAIEAGVSEAFAMMAAKPMDNESTTPAEREQDRAAFEAEAALSQRRALVLGITPYVWGGFAYLAGGWLTLSGLTGVFGWRGSRPLQKVAAWLILLSTAVSIGSIWAAIKWGGMPPHADLPFYAKVGAVQSSYGWFLLLATRLAR